MDQPTDQPPRRTKRPLPGTAGDDGGGGSSRDDTSFVDANGIFVERAARGGTKEEAWLGPADDADAPAATKRAMKALRKQEEDEGLLDDVVSSRAVFEIQKRIVGILWPGETVPQALRRLKESAGQTGGRFPGAASTSSGAGARGSGGRMDEATQRAFDDLTGAAAELMQRGDLDAYSHEFEEFERAAWDYEYGRRRRLRDSASAAQEVEGEYKTDHTAAATVDMFGDDDVSDGTGAKTEADSAGGQAVDPGQPAAAEGEGGEGTGVAGWDYVYDPASGYYYSESTGYYYDAASGYYGSACTGTWFSYDDGAGGQCSGTDKEM